MMYQAVMNIGGSKPQQIRSGVWETSDKAWDELCGMTHGKIPTKTSWCAWLTIKSRI